MLFIYYFENYNNNNNNNNNIYNSKNIIANENRYWIINKKK